MLDIPPIRPVWRGNRRHIMEARRSRQYALYLAVRAAAKSPRVYAIGCTPAAAAMNRRQKCNIKYNGRCVPVCK